MADPDWLIVTHTPFEALPDSTSANKIHLSSFLKIQFEILFTLSVCICLYVNPCSVSLHCPQRSEEGVRVPGACFTDGCYLLCGC